MQCQAPAGESGVQGWIAGFAMFAAMAFGVLALVAPWPRLARSRREAARTAGALAVACTLTAVISAILMPAKYDIRIDLLINGALVLLAWIVYAGLALIARAGESEKEG